MHSVLQPMRIVLALGLLCIAQAGLAAPVEIVALFKDRAVIKTQAGEAMLRVGETSADGVTLIDADPFQARVRYQGKEYPLRLSARVGSVFAKPTANAVHINRDPLGQYRVRGTIDDHLVDFLVDTGASIVAISERQATAMGLDFRAGEPGYVETAQGTAQAYFLSLDKVTVGGISVHGVESAVIQGRFPVDVLLGMSFLNHVQMQDNNGVLTLTARY
ncbi:MAG: retropepsin-like aspartic protease [Pseudomonadota bacterium]